MSQAKTYPLTIAEMREYAAFTADEQDFIARSLAVFSGRNSDHPDQARAYRELPLLKESLPSEHRLDGVAFFVGALARISAQDLTEERIESFSAYRFLYERLLGAASRPFLPSAFCAAAALPHIRPCRRKMLLQSLSEAAATAPGWSDREPCFYPEPVPAEAA